MDGKRGFICLTATINWRLRAFLRAIKKKYMDFNISYFKQIKNDSIRRKASITFIVIWGLALIIILPIAIIPILILYNIARFCEIFINGCDKFKFYILKKISKHYTK